MRLGLGGWPYATGGLAVALALSLAWGLRVDGLRAAHQAAHAETKRTYRDAQATAQAAFDAQIAALTARNRRVNDAADQQSDHLRIVYRDRVISLPSAPAGCAAGGTGLPAADLPPRADRSGGDTVLLAREDVLICATNIARLEAARDWAIKMMGPD